MQNKSQTEGMLGKNLCQLESQGESRANKHKSKFEQVTWDQGVCSPCDLRFEPYGC
jgi:hypothetical protein